MTTTKKIYFDSVSGVKSLLKDESSYNRDAIDRADYKPVGWTPGAWLVTFTNGQSLVAYVAGHPDTGSFEDTTKIPK